MRNLKKILALVLALVMSFSLMATASAFSDDGDIAADYAEAIDVLSGLEVFKGYDNGATFQPKGSITRAEVAAIIYRIATGDVKDAQTSIYSSWGQFNDVKDGSWYAGYVNYCANAGYIKGYDSKTFGPNDPVTGYQALAMILRAIGYDKNNEFTGSNWQVRTASIAKQRGITDNIVDTLLGQSATREVVAEILFQSILVKTVTFNTNTLSYSENATSLGYDVLKLEKIEGVVVANQYADLADDEGMATGKTRIESADGDRTLNVVTTLDDIGESRYVYAKKTSNNGYNLVTDKMYDTGDNVIADQGAEIKVKDLAKKAKNADGNEQAIATNDDTEYFVNFNEPISETSDYRLRYVIADTDAITSGQRAFLNNEVDAKRATYETPASGTAYWDRVIKPEERIDAVDRALMQAIFYNADRNTSYTPGAVVVARDYVYGEVYVGTTALKDYSDTMSWKEFVNEYIGENEFSFDKTYNGYYLKLIDNNNDGIVEYALRTDYVLDEVVSITTKNDENTYYYNGLGASDDVVFENDTTLKIGDVILYAEIDGKYYAEIVTPVAGTIKAKNIKDVTVTTTDDTVYEDSYVANNTVDKDDEILNMDQQVEYQLYLDKFGHIAAYDLDGSRYALLTEMYPSRNFNGQYVTDGTWIAEVMTGSDVAPQEYDVLNSYVNRNVTNPFIGAAWTSATHHVFNNSTSWIANRLQPATARLDRETRYTPVRAPFDYDSTSNILYTNTNVAKFTKSEDGVNLYTAAEFQTKNGDQLYYADLYNGGNLSQTGDGIYEKYTESEFRTTFQKVWNAPAQDADMNELRKLPVYDTDYIQLAVGAVKAGTEHFTASVYPYNQAAESTAAAQYATSYINAVDSTEFYVVGPYSIQHYVGYKNLPAIAAKDVETMYAVAQNVDRANDGRDYWVADVIVIEVNNQYWYDRVDTVFEANNATSRNTLALKNGNLYLDVIDSKDTAVNSLVPDYSTWNSAYDRGFYGVADSENIDTNTIAGTVERLGPATVLVTNPNSAQWNSYNDAGVHAGVVTRSAYIMNNSVYIDVDGKAVEIGYNTAMIIGRSNNASRWNAESTGYTNLLAGHRVIYVKTGSGTVDYVLDLTYTKSGSWTNAGSSWLATEYSNIVKEQNQRTSGLITITHEGEYDFEIYEEKDGSIVNLPNMATKSEMADYTIGNEICIPVSLFEISTVSALNGLVEFDAENSWYNGVEATSGNTFKTGVRNNTLCYVFPANIDTLALHVVYKYVDGKSLNDVLDTVVALTDNTGKTEEGGSVVVGDSNIETVTTMPDVTTLARATDAYVKVSFNLENGYYNPSVKLGSTNLKVFTAADGTWDPAEGYAYAVYFKLGVSNVLVITAVNNANPIYTVALDTSVANINFDSKTSDIYRVNSDTKVTFTVRTNGDYNVDLDTAPYASVAISDPTVVGSGSTAVQTWTITVTKVTANTKVVLKATPKIN